MKGDTVGDAGGVLLVDGSALGRQLLGQLLRPRFARLVEATDCAQARAALEVLGPFDAVVVDLEAATDAPGLVSALCASRPAPAVVVTTRVPELDLETRLAMRGVCGILSKPIRAKALFHALRGIERSLFVPVATRTVANLPDIWADAIDPPSGGPIVRWEVREISREGALMLTHTAFAIGTKLTLRFQLLGDPFELTAEVVRMRDPASAVLPGIEVRFLDLAENGARAIDRLRGTAPMG